MIEIYKTPEDEREGIGIWLNHFGTIEDHYFTTAELAEKHNYKRMKRFAIFLTFFLWEINLRIPLKTIGEIFYGRDIKKEREERQKRIETRKKTKDSKSGI